MGGLKEFLSLIRRYIFFRLISSNNDRDCFLLRQMNLLQNLFFQLDVIKPRLKLIY